MSRTLWRIDGGTTVRDSEHLRTGLRLHTDHVDLTTILLQINAEQRAYIATEGCDGCLQGSCQPGCDSDRLRRLLRSCMTNLTLTMVPHGLAQRPYTRIVLAWPSLLVQPITNTFTQLWSEARLTIYWMKGRAGLALALGAEGPDPLDALRAIGWSGREQPARLFSISDMRFFVQPIPEAFPLLFPCKVVPTLLTPGVAVQPVVAVQEQAVGLSMPFEYRKP